MRKAKHMLLSAVGARVFVASFAVLALALCYTGTVHANGVTRSAKNTAESQRAALCYDTSAQNVNVTTFGVVWINGTPTTSTTDARWSESLTVAWNATTVSAYMWTTAYNCPASQGGVPFSSAQIYSLAPASGGSVPITFPSGTSISRGTGTTYAGQFTNPPGGLRVNLNVSGKASGCYSVAYSGRYKDSRGTGLPNTYFTRVCITRQPVPPATLDGVKIDDSRTGTYGGATNPAYNGLTVSVSGGPGSDSRNPFFFTSATGGGDPITIGSTGVSTRNVSINTTGLAPGFRLRGYSICPTSAGDCTTTNLAYGAKYYKALPVGTTSFSQVFAAGRTYHMRWIFDNIVGISCGVFTPSPDRIDSSTHFSGTATVRFNTAYTPTSPTMTLVSFSPAIPINGNRTVIPPTITATPTGSLATVTFGRDNASQLGPSGATGTYTVTWRYDDASVTPVTCTDTFTIANMPYMAVYGGDVVVGESPTVDTACYQNSEGGAYGWSNYTSNFRGAGSQYAVMAMGTIQEFAGSLGTTTPDKLVFANVDYGPANAVHNVGAGLYGGMFGATNTPCDFLSDIASAPNSSVTNIGARTVTSNSDVLHVGNNVYISGNIAYGSTSWANTAAIPSFKLVVEGDIYIDNDVSQLDGLYVALTNEDGTSGGNIYTCATSIGNDVKPNTPGFFATCHKKLTVNGAFVAKQVHFQRTIGTLGQSATDTPTANNAAEVFNYTPELWLPRSNTALGGQWMSVTGLPPVL